jgi:peptidyl-prolyl cis-trans isomerase SurA
MRLLAVLLAGINSGNIVAEIVDRIAVTVANTVITESEVNRQIRLTAFLNGEKPEFSPESKRRAADMLVEQALVRREMNASPGTAGPDTPAVDPQVEVVLKARYPSAAALQHAIAEYGLTEVDVRRHLEWQTRLIHFIDLRFRPGVQIPESELREYYESTYVPQWSASHKGKPPGYEESREEVQNLLLSERANQALDRWIGQMRTQTRIRYRQESFQ